MNKKKLVYDIALVLVPVLLLVFLIINHGFESFKLLEGLVDAFQYGFFLGLTYICLPLSIIADMVLLCAAVYMLLRTLKVIKFEKLDAVMGYVRLVSTCVLLFCMAVVYGHLFYIYFG